MRDVFAFAWLKPINGFQWVKGKSLSTGKEDDFLVLVRTPKKMPEFNTYFPLEEFSGLFHTFAETPPTKTGIIDFANKYGFLEIENLESIEIGENGEQEKGESLSFWQKEITVMHQALELWNAVNNNDQETLSKYIRWDHDKKIIDFSLSEYIKWRPFPEPFTPFDLISPALFCLQQVLNHHLSGRVSPQVYKRDSTNKLTLYIVPNSLIGALWLQFAQAIDGNKEFRRCEECRTWFELSPETARTSKLYCSNACRSRAYRKRQAEARRLYEQGKSVKEIAEIIGTDVSTVQGWIAKKGGLTNGGQFGTKG